MSEKSYQEDVAEMFSKAENSEAVIDLLIGAASVLWEDLSGAGVFQTDCALILAREAQHALEQWGLPE